jgi:hypothetical protein
MKPPRPLIVAKLNSEKHLLYVIGFFAPFRPRLALKTEDNVHVSKL